MLLAWRNLLQDRLRSTLSIVGVGFALMLMLILNGFLTGLGLQTSAYLDHAPGTVVIARTNVSNFFVAGLPIPPGVDKEVRKIPGVAGVVPLLTRSVYFNLDGQKQSTYMVGYDAALGGGPWNLGEGREPGTDTEIVVDRILAQQHQLALGDHLTVLNRSFTIVGISAGGSTWAMSLLFIRRTAAESLLLAPDAANYLLVTPAAGVSAEGLRDQLRALPDTSVLLKSEVIANDVQTFTRIFSAPIQLMVVVAFLIGVLIVGLMTFTAAVERQREYGVLKAVGARNWRLYRVVTNQAGVVAIAGALLGVALALVAGQLIMLLRPQFLIALEPLTTLEAMGAALFMAFLAAVFPARLIAGLAPAEVFRR